MTNSASTCLA
jgi:hypothetical protein